MIKKVLYITADYAEDAD